MNHKLLVLLLGVALSPALVACGHCDAATEDMDAFLADPANQACSTDADCTRFASCADLDGAMCQQVGLSVSARESAEFATLADGLDDCSDSCDQCDALLLPTCTDGVCWTAH